MKNNVLHRSTTWDWEQDTQDTEVTIPPPHPRLPELGTGRCHPSHNPEAEEEALLRDLEELEEDFSPSCSATPWILKVGWMDRDEEKQDRKEEEGKEEQEKYRKHNYRGRET